VNVPLKILGLAAVLTLGFGAFGQQAQETEQPQQQGGNQQVARPNGQLPGNVSIEFVKVVDGLTDPVNVAHANDGSGRVFVVERVGRIRIVDQNGNLVEEPFLDIRENVKIDFLEQGMLGLAFHPNYSENGRFYVYYNDYVTNGQSFIAEYTVSGDNPDRADPESERLLLAVPQPYVNHNGGTIQFGPDGYLYIALGDGGLAGDPFNTAQDTGDRLGSILRIDVDQQMIGRPYGIPEDNPFITGTQAVDFGLPNAAQYRPNAAPEIWAYGLRNPWRISFDPETGDLYIPDVGQDWIEEINVVPANRETQRSLNFGWPLMEGSSCYPPGEATRAEETAAEGCNVGILPVAEYTHEQGDCSITGFGVYRGDEFPDLNGIYFNSDYCSGRVWGLTRGDDGNWVYQELLQLGVQATGGGNDEAGNVYMTTCQCEWDRAYAVNPTANGALWRIVPAGQVPEGAETATTTEGEDTAGEASEAGTEQEDDDEGEGQVEERREDEQQPGQEEQQDQQQDEQQNEQQEEQNNQGQGESNQQAGATMDPAQHQELVQRGEQVYQACAGCHGANGRGGRGIPALAGNEELADTQHVVHQIIHGGGGMPPFGHLPDDDIAAVATFIRSSWENDFGAVSTEQVAEQRD
jgi:glucose/arabinose dehydrogenase/cytochrome c553